jgi:uncharacterized Zn-finger protein
MADQSISLGLILDSPVNSINSCRNLPPELTLTSISSSFKSLDAQPDSSKIAKSFICNECGKAFPRHGRLKIHERIHVCFYNC